MTSTVATSCDEKRTWQGGEKVSMFSQFRLPLSCLVAKSGRELLPPTFSDSNSLFPSPIPLVLLLHYCPYSFHLKSFFTQHFNCVILPFLCLPYLFPDVPLSSLFPSCFFFLCLPPVCRSFTQALFPTPSLRLCVFHLSIISVCLPFSSLLPLPHPSSPLHYLNGDLPVPLPPSSVWDSCIEVIGKGRND